MAGVDEVAVTAAVSQLLSAPVEDQPIRLTLGYSNENWRVRWFRAEGYHLVDIDCGEWTSAAAMHDAVSQAFSFPDYYGRNLDALNDCLFDVGYYEYGTSEAATGTILVLSRFDAFVAVDRRVAHIFLDVFADNARRAALIGHRMLCLVQSDDPRLELEPVGATALDWNPREWLTAKRIPDDH